MRPGQQQQNKQRMRGRGGRKGPNPLSRSFESNGPDVKIRGTAQHIADKYTTLARDAAAAGDRVMAENYLQHAEHYGRIVAAAQGAFQPSQPERDYADFDEDGDDEGQGPEMAQPYAGGGQERPQGGFNGERNGFNGERPAHGERHGGDRQNFRDGQNGRGDRRDHRDNRGDRPFQNRDGQNRDGFARDGQNRDHQGREDRRERDGRDQRQPGTGPQPFPPAAEFEGEAGAPRQDGGRFEGGRRESRRDRQRSNERSGERRFEERFGRPRLQDDDRGDATPAAAASQPEIATPMSVAPSPVDAAPQLSPVSAFEPTPDTQAPAAEGRGRGRRRREVVGDEVAAPAALAPEVPQVVPAAEVPPAPTRRRAAKPVSAPEPDVASAAAEDDAAPKRRAPRARRKKDEGEAGGEDGRTPALITTDN